MCGAVPCLWAQPEPVCAVLEMWAPHPMEGGRWQACGAMFSLECSVQRVVAWLQNIWNMHIFSFTDGACTSFWRPPWTLLPEHVVRGAALAHRVHPRLDEDLLHVLRDPQRLVQSTWSGTFSPPRCSSLRQASSSRWVWRSEGGHPLPCPWQRQSHLDLGSFKNQIKSKTQKWIKTKPIKMTDTNR